MLFIQFLLIWFLPKVLPGIVTIFLEWLDNALFCKSLHFHVHADVLVQDCVNSSALAMELLQSCSKPSMYCYRNPALTHFFDDKYPNGRGQ